MMRADCFVKDFRCFWRVAVQEKGAAGNLPRL